VSSEEGGQIGLLLLRNEQALLDPAVRRDRDRVSALLAEDFVEFGASGRAWTREEILDLLATEDYEPPAVEDFRCVPIGMGVALVTYRTVRTDWQTGAISAALRSSLWTKEAGEWRVRFHQGTPAGAGAMPSGG
jgi:hypothetical protein